MKKLLIKTGTYQKDGQTKNRYTQLGVLMENENGEYMLLDPSVNLSGCLIQQNSMNQTPSTRLMVSVFDDAHRAPQSHPSGTTGQTQPQTQPAAPQKQNGNVFDDDINF